jgi:3-hydroxyisobutyrate dehydrogenase-like beta-hydroxyacid dehydrogenase
MSDRPVVGLLHPGEMGSAIGATLVASGNRVLWASAGRGAQTRERAAGLGLDDAGSVEALAKQAVTIVSVAPPHAALDVAREVAGFRFRGIFVDANAVATETAMTIKRLIEDAGGRFVDGGIIGPANRKPGAARIYLAGTEAAAVKRLLEAGPVTPIALPGAPPAASALKIAYGGWNKASQALLMAIRAYALAEGADEALLAEWALSQPDLPARSQRAINDNARKAWRFVGEMEEDARALADAGLPAGFHEAAADIYQRLAAYKDTATPPAVAEALAELLKRRRG